MGSAPIELTEREQGYSLALGSVHRIAANKSQSLTRAHPDTFLLERCSHHGFGRYVSFYEFADQDPGLLIWRRDRSEQPILIVADERRIVDARDQDQHPLVPEYQDRLSDPFPVPTGLGLCAYRHPPRRGEQRFDPGCAAELWAGSLDVGVQEVWDDGLPEWDVDTVYESGDVTVPEGTTLTIESGTVVGSGRALGQGCSATIGLLQIRYTQAAGRLLI